MSMGKKLESVGLAIIDMGKELIDMAKANTPEIPLWGNWCCYVASGKDVRHVHMVDDDCVILKKRMIEKKWIISHYHFWKITVINNKISWEYLGLGNT